MPCASCGHLVVRLFCAGEYFGLMSVPRSMHCFFLLPAKFGGAVLSAQVPIGVHTQAWWVPAVQAFSFCPLDWNCTKMNTLTCWQSGIVPRGISRFVFLPPLHSVKRCFHCLYIQCNLFKLSVFTYLLPSLCKCSC